MMQQQYQPGNLIMLEGTLIADAQARVLPTDRDGHMAPVLCLDVRCENATQNHIRVEQPFPPGTDARCRAAAKRYRKGMQVRFETPLAWLTLLARNTAHIHIVGPDEQPEETTA
jgi:hypothetical protein